MSTGIRHTGGLIYKYFTVVIYCCIKNKLLLTRELVKPRLRVKSTWIAGSGGHIIVILFITVVIYTRKMFIVTANGGKTV